MANEMSKKEAIQELEYVLVNLENREDDPETKYLGIFIYNILIFHFGVSKKKLDKIIKTK